ncbi:MAG: hypothetical protein IJ060_13060 [Oscillospiraceae bacterium]|nr:hypothetical protein [Oscillospiraceae bacterium]
MRGFQGTAAVLSGLLLFAGGCGQRAPQPEQAESAQEPELTQPPDAESPQALTSRIAEALCRTERTVELRLPASAAQWDIPACIGKARAERVPAAEGLKAVQWQLRGNVLTVQPEYRAGQDTLRREKAELMLCAVQFAASSADCSPAEKALLIHDRLLRECSYRPGAAEGDSAAGALLLHEAECGGYAAGFALLAEAAGLPCRIVSGTADGAPHAWNLAELDGAWYHIDCAWDDTEPAQPHRYFLRSDAEMRRTHTWDAGAYPAAEGAACSYAEIAAGMQLRE